MRRKNTFYKATTLAMTSVLALGAPVIAHAENTEGTNLSDEGYPEINPQIAALENQELEIWLPADQGQDPNFQTVKEKFEESYPNITINYNTSIPWEEMPSKVKLAVNSGAAPDLALHPSLQVHRDLQSHLMISGKNGVRKMNSWKVLFRTVPGTM